MRRLLAILVLCGVLGLGACGGDRDAPAPAATPGDGATQLDPAAFARAVSEPGTVTVNVHVPYAGQIRGTDRFIPYTEVGDRLDKLPDRETRIALYCRSGRMSAIAARTLRKRGYRRLVELHGGMDAWTAAGRALLQR